MPAGMPAVPADGDGNGNGDGNGTKLAPLLFVPRRASDSAKL